ncbi:MAG: hypothetical protein HYS70_02385 [Nitrospinae bacterium]|nr:hypothetical protein [Nitrospinota bacterium]
MMEVKHYEEELLQEIKRLPAVLPVIVNFYRENAQGSWRPIFIRGGGQLGLAMSV